MVDLLPIQDVYGNLLASGLWQLITSRPLQSDYPRLSLSDELLSEVGRRVDWLLEQDGMAPFGRDDGEPFRRLLMRPELPSLFGHMFVLMDAGRTARRPKPREKPQAVDALAVLWAQESGRKQEDARIDVGHLYTNLQQVASELIRIAIAKDELTGSTAMLSEGTHLLVEQIEAVSRQLELLRDPDLDEREVRDFVARLKDAVRARFTKVDLADVHDRARVDLNDIFVEPRLSAGISLDVDDTPQDWGLADTLMSARRVVILGDPGAGKTTVLHRTCTGIASLQAVHEPPLVPLFVTLRTYMPSGLSLTEYLERSAARDYEMQTVPKGAIEYLLTSGQGFLLLDGLDEILDSSGRRTARDRVESLVRQYPQCRVAVTSRVVGYAEAPLDRNLFAHFRVRDFGPRQIRDYANKWYRLVGQHAQDAEPKALAFLRESEELDDLRSTPLLLALLCALFNEEHTIPRQRAEIYERCARLLFDRWDARRRIRPQLPAEEYVREFIQDLARWFLEEPERREGVPTPELEAQATRFLADRVYGSSARAAAPAREFVDFLSGRAWVLSGIGGRGDSELFKFTHNSFLEYFAAEDMLASADSTEELARTVVQYELADERHLVNQLALQLRARRQAGSSDEILRYLITSAAADRVTLYRFALRALPGLRPKPAAARHLAETLADHFCTSVPSTDPVEAITQLNLARPEVIEVVTGALITRLGHHLNGGNDDQAIRALEVLGWCGHNGMEPLADAARAELARSDGLVARLHGTERSAAAMLAIIDLSSCAAVAADHGVASLCDEIEVSVSGRRLRPLVLGAALRRIESDEAGAWGDRGLLAELLARPDWALGGSASTRWSMHLSTDARLNLEAVDDDDLFVSAMMAGIAAHALPGYASRMRFQSALSQHSGSVADLSNAVLDARLASPAAAVPTRMRLKAHAEQLGITGDRRDRLLYVGSSL